MALIKPQRPTILYTTGKSSFAQLVFWGTYVTQLVQQNKFLLAEAFAANWVINLIYKTGTMASTLQLAKAISSH